jgi:hypothetical protein
MAPEFLALSPDEMQKFIAAKLAQSIEVLDFTTTSLEAVEAIAIELGSPPLLRRPAATTQTTRPKLHIIPPKD